MIKLKNVRMSFEWTLRDLDTGHETPLRFHMQMTERNQASLRRVAFMIRVIEICGHNPQRLLEYKPDPEETLRSWYNTELGETYDPANYRKD